jgi:hypothetical protein
MIAFLRTEHLRQRLNPLAIAEGNLAPRTALIG